MWQFISRTQGTVTKSSLDNTTTSKMAGLVKGITNQVVMMMVMVMVMTTMMAGLVNGITNQARSVVRDLDPVNELAFLRLRSTKTEFLIAPGDLRQCRDSRFYDACIFRQGLCPCCSSDTTVGVDLYFHRCFRE